MDNLIEPVGGDLSYSFSLIPFSDRHASLLLKQHKEVLQLINLLFQKMLIFLRFFQFLIKLFILN
jgi:hypothetical protein